MLEVRRFARVERGLRESQMALNMHCERVRAAEHAPRDPFCVSERFHGLAEIVERGTVVRKPTGPGGDKKKHTGQRARKDEEIGQVGAAVLRLGRGGPRPSLRRAGHGRGRGRVPRGVLRAGAQEPEKRDVEREAAAPGALIDSLPPVPRGPC